MKNKNLHFKINVPQFLKEIIDSTIVQGNNNGVLLVPLNVFRNYLVKIADRAGQINDPILNKIMCDMAMYEVADQYNPNYDKKIVDKVDKDAEDYIKKQA